MKDSDKRLTDLQRLLPAMKKGKNTHKAWRNEFEKAKVSGLFMRNDTQIQSRGHNPSSFNAFLMISLCFVLFRQDLSQFTMESCLAQSCGLFSWSVACLRLWRDGSVHTETRALVLHHYHGNPGRLHGVWNGSLRSCACKRHTHAAQAVLK